MLVKVVENFYRNIFKHYNIFDLFMSSHRNRAVGPNISRYFNLRVLIPEIFSRNGCQVFCETQLFIYLNHTSNLVTTLVVVTKITILDILAHEEASPSCRPCQIWIQDNVQS